MRFLREKDNAPCEFTKNSRLALIRFNNKSFSEYILCSLKKKAKPI